MSRQMKPARALVRVLTVVALCFSPAWNAPARAPDAQAKPRDIPAAPQRAGSRETITFSGQVRRSEDFQKAFAQNLVFELFPIEKGWKIQVHKQGHPEDLARLTPPPNGLNDTDIEGWHFRNKDNTGPSDAFVNFPQRKRGFILSPSVGETIPAADDGYPTMDEICQIEHDGSGRLTITQLKLGELRPFHQAHIEEMAFQVSIDLGSSRPRFTHWCALPH